MQQNFIIHLVFIFIVSEILSCSKSEPESQQNISATEMSKNWKDSFEIDQINSVFETFYSHQDLLKSNSKILPSNQKLQISLQTIQLPPESVYLIGLKTKQSKSFFLENEKQEKKINPHQLGFTLDWNQQFNGSYLSAGLIITQSSQIPSFQSLSDYIAIEYIGVPPGKNGRLQISEKHAGNLKIVYDEGWPQLQREGKLLGIQKILAQYSSQGLEIKENDNIVLHSHHTALFEQSVFFYFFVQSHNNYYERTVFFDDIFVQSMK